MRLHLIIIQFLSLLIFCSAQNQNKKWVLGTGYGIDFMQSPPALTIGSATLSSSIPGVYSAASDVNGNLLFYTDGKKVYNQAHAIMANGNGLLGDLAGAGWAELIVKKPGSNSLYYIFTVNAFASSMLNGGGYRYSIVDMSLAAGMGSVTTKNVLIYDPPTSPYFTGMNINATQHCNGSDFWIVTHDRGSAVFRSYLLSSAGLNTAAVTSTVGDVMNDQGRQIKISPTGKKIALCLNWGIYAPSSINVHDFDNSTGAVSSNSMALITPTPAPNGCEFSPDGKILYASTAYGGYPGIFQWDLCAGNAQAVNSSYNFISQGVISNTYTTGSYNAFQLADDGKIYISVDSQNGIAVIHNPNAYGSACNLVRQSFLFPQNSGNS
ncbi:MAG: hypothetical protein WCR21_08680, partial [Bacteroidota bacterium]